MASVHDVSNKILSRYLNYIVDVIMWAKFSNSNITVTNSYHNLNFIRIWPKKSISLRGALGLSSITWDWH